ncbi:hypothetical protein OF83DRAFT_409945 [Amylostereum chailletii]|nr:hypothetical protein OF83DRAFT_409945 [Amylostereum chailletii]
MQPPNVISDLQVALRVQRDPNNRTFPTTLRKLSSYSFAFKALYEKKSLFDYLPPHQVPFSQCPVISLDMDYDRAKVMLQDCEQDCALGRSGNLFGSVGGLALVSAISLKNTVREAILEDYLQFTCPDARTLALIYQQAYDRGADATKELMVICARNFLRFPIEEIPRQYISEHPFALLTTFHTACTNICAEHSASGTRPIVKPPRALFQGVSVKGARCSCDVEHTRNSMDATDDLKSWVAKFLLTAHEDQFLGTRPSSLVLKDPRVQGPAFAIASPCMNCINFFRVDVLNSDKPTFDVAVTLRSNSNFGKFVDMYGARLNLLYDKQWESLINDQ